MVNIITGLAKYIIVFLMVGYTLSCFSIFGYSDVVKKHNALIRQNWFMFIIHFLAYLSLYLRSGEMRYLYFYVVQVILFASTILLYTHIYPKISRLVVNNMCMLLCLGFIMISRLDFEKCVKQFVIVAASLALSLAFPVIIRKVRFLEDAKFTYIYAGIGIVALAAVAVIGQTSYGAKLGFSIAGISVQPSEFVKIVFVFFVASTLSKSTEFKNVVKATMIAALHVLILFASRDLGAALILFIVYLVMLYVATKQPLYMLAGLAAGSGAAVVGYHVMAHVRTRVLIWKDPIAAYSISGQVAQSLFAIGTGSWFGMGLLQGSPNTIPVATEDFIFSAISEEMGLIVGLCIILICVSVYIMFLNIAMKIREQFYKLIALGLGTCYIFQVFLMIGGVTKFIPSTGVTLPLVSYGGSSVLSSLIMFALIQGLYILREDEEEDIERQRELDLRRERKRTKAEVGRRSQKGGARRTPRAGSSRSLKESKGTRTHSTSQKEGSKKGSQTGRKKETGRQQRVR